MVHKGELFMRVMINNGYIHSHGRPAVASVKAPIQTHFSETFATSVRHVPIICLGRHQRLRSFGELGQAINQQ